MFLLDPAEGLRRLSRALHHQVPMDWLATKPPRASS
jgi:hypothetical protein